MDVKVCIAVPSGDVMHPRFVASLINLIRHSGDINCDYANQISSRITDNRNTLVGMARDYAATHILFIDADMTFPADGLKRLLAYDVDIVGATASKRQEGDRNPIGIPADEGDRSTNKSLVEMKMMGLPFMLIRTSVFEKLPKPWFAEPIDGEGLIPEDAYFCKMAREAGYKIWCDMALTVDMGHLGIKEYKVEPVKEKPQLRIVEAA